MAMTLLQLFKPELLERIRKPVLTEGVKGKRTEPSVRVDKAAVVEGYHKINLRETFERARRDMGVL